MIKLSLCTFLKNEGQTIYRMLDSCKSFTDEYVIGVDNSCTDNTEPEVLRFIEDNPKLSIKFYKFDWNESFAYHRNEGMDMATGDWILVMDGHEYFPESWTNITEKRKTNSQQIMGFVKGHLRKDGIEEEGGNIRECDSVFLNLYQQPFIGETPNNFFMQPRIYRNGMSVTHPSEKIRFGRAAHNCIMYTRPELDANYPEAIIIHDAPDENRKERSIQRQEMNIKQLKEDLAKNDKDTRAMFYLANTYLEGKKYEEAEEWYKKYIDNIKVETDEAYQCYLHLALLYKELKEFDKAIKCLSNSIRINPTKRDAFLLTGDMYGEKEEWEKAIQFYNIAISIKAPVSRMFSNGGTYTWLPHQQLCIAYKAIGNYEMAIAHIKICLGYVQTEGWLQELKEMTGDKRNVLIIDHIGSFTNEFKEYLENKTYNVLLVKDFSRTLAVWADVIFCEWGDRNALLCNEFKNKTLVRIHGYEAYLNKDGVDQIEAKKVIYVAQHIKDKIGLAGEVIPNGVDTDKFYITDSVRKKDYCGVIGYMNSKKNPMRLARIIKENPDITFHLRIDWQDAFLESSFKYETENCDNIVYHGRYEDLKQFYNQMQYILSTSDIESFSYAIAEGMACGCTPLIYNWEGAKDIWRRDMIFKDLPKFKPKDSKEMRQYIIDNYPLHKQMIAMETLLLG